MIAFAPEVKFLTPLEERQQELHGWMQERKEHNRLSVREIVDASGIYPIIFLDLLTDSKGGSDKQRYNDCYRDLRRLQRLGKVAKIVGDRPIRWAAWPFA